MSNLECIICFESKNSLYKCDRCATRLCEECYKQIKRKSCTVCNLEIFNKELNELSPIKLNLKVRLKDKFKNKHIKFATEPIVQTFNNEVQFGKTASVTIYRNGDLVPFILHN